MLHVHRKEKSHPAKAVPFVFAVIAVKLVFHRFGMEYISLNTIFSGIIGATVFLLFLIRDLDNPLGCYEESSSENVSLVRSATQ